MAVSKILIEIAKRSPKEFAEQIKKRNSQLLKKLNTLYKKHRKAPSDQWGKENVYIGCPHCNIKYNCKSCVWRKVRKYKIRPYSVACCTAKFNGFTLMDLCSMRNGVRRYGFVIEYGYSDATVRVSACSPSEFEKSYQRAKKFLEGHIEWAELDCWGEKYKEQL